MHRGYLATLAGADINVEVGDEEQTFLQVEALDAVLGGITFTPGEWASLSYADRCAFAFAGREKMRLAAALNATAGIKAQAGDLDTWGIGDPDALDEAEERAEVADAFTRTATQWKLARRVG